MRTAARSAQSSTTRRLGAAAAVGTLKPSHKKSSDCIGVVNNGMAILDLPQDPHDPANVPCQSKGRLKSQEVDGLVVQDVGVKPLNTALIPEEDAGPRSRVRHGGGHYPSICMRVARVRIAIGPAVKVAVIR